MVGRGGGREVRDLIGLYFAWLRGVEGERFYLRGRSNLLFMPFFFKYYFMQECFIQYVYALSNPPNPPS